jgi:Sulfotransferase family
MPTGGPPIFVVGYQRSGTTLLQSLIGAHPHIAAPPELHFILRVAHLATVFGDLADDRNLRRALHEALNPPADLFADAGFDEDVIFESARAGPRTYAGLFDAILQDYADREGKPRWSEKTPSQRLGDIYGLFPDALAVHILRDPREIVASNLQMPWERRSAAVIARAVRSFTLGSIRRGRRAGPGQYMQVRYEDLTRDPESVLRQVCVFLGEEYDENMLDPARRGGAIFRVAEWQHRAAEPVATPQSMNWPKVLSRVDRLRVQAFTSELLEPFGYNAPSRAARTLAPLARAQVALRYAIPDTYARMTRPKTPQQRYDAVQRLVSDGTQNLPSPRAKVSAPGPRQREPR